MRETRTQRLVRSIVIAAMALAALNAVVVTYKALIGAEGDSEVPVAGSRALPAGGMGGSYPIGGQAEGAAFARLALPSRLVIPKLGIETEVLEVGVTESGNMGVPKSYQKVGWYKYGALPGENGSSVIAGHVDNGFGLSGVFARLHELSPGDEVRVVDTEGETAVFRVTGAKTYDRNDPTAAEVFSNSREPRLNLITCNGAWVRDEKTYDKRLVVFAERVS